MTFRSCYPILRTVTLKALTNNLYTVGSHGQLATKMSALMLTKKPSQLLAGLLMLASMLLTLNVYAQANAAPKASAQPANDSADVRINMNNAEIRSVIQWVAEKTNKNFIIDPRVKGRISVLSNQPMSMDQAYQVFLTALDVYGFAAVESGNNVKIIPNAQARSAGLPIVETFNNPDADNSELVLHVIKVNNISANEVVTILRPLVPQTGHLGAFPSSNSVIIADRANNINRLSKLVSYIDSTGDIDIEVIQLTHATADDVVSVLQPLLKSGKGSTDVTGINFATDARSNSILMTGNEDKRALVRDLIDSLDRPLQGTGNTKVVFLNYIDAEEIKPILEGMTGSIQEDQKNAAIADSGISIQSSETNNALIITAPPSILESIETVITELDVKRSQVMIEAIIVEVTDSFSNTLEILWGTSPTLSGGVSSANLLGSTSSALAVSDNPGAALIQSGLNWGFFRNGSLRSLLHAVASDNNNNVLSTPSIITIDNEEAEILVGSNVPFVTGSQTSAATSTNNPFRTIQREDIGITLKITPKVSKQRTITLAVEQEVESVREEQISAAQDLITDKRSIKTNVLVDDGTILVLGGLIEDRTTRSQTKVPLLGDIPLLGRFFSSDTKTVRKQNLMVFIKTTIIDDLSLAEEKTRTSYNDIRAKQKGLGDRKEKLTLPDFDSQIPDDRADNQAIENKSSVIKSTVN